MFDPSLVSKYTCVLRFPIQPNPIQFPKRFLSRDLYPDHTRVKDDKFEKYEIDHEESP